MSVSSNRADSFTTPLPASRVRIVFAALALVVAILLAYHNSFGVPFLFDDIVSIAENPAIHRFSLASTFAAEQAGGLTTSGRPLLALSFALNHAMSGDQVWSYHATNLLIHACAAFCLFGVVRRTLLMPVLSGRFGSAALPIAFIVAALWAVHPLQTEAVTYTVQRAESLAGLLYLLTLYAFIRSVACHPLSDKRPPRFWQALSLLACALGMATKEIMVTVPLLVLFYDRTFVSGTFREAWRRRRGFYLMLGATWLILGLLIGRSGGRGGTAGFGTEMSSWSYLLTQSRAIVRYLGLSVWPANLVFDYGRETVRWIDVIPQGLVILTMIAGVVIAIKRWPAAGFVGACFFALLAPSSSIVPVATQTMAEHRMYLPLAAVVTGVVVGAYRWIGFRSLWFSTAAVIALGGATATRNDDYRSELTLWSDTVTKWPANPRAHNNLGQALFRVGKVSESVAYYQHAVKLQPGYPEPYYNLGVSLARLGQVPLAIEHYETALRWQPNYPEAHNNLGSALVRTGRFAEAIRHYEQALATRPMFAEAHNNLGDALLKSGRPKDAEPHFRRALELKPDYAEASYNLGNVHAAAGAMQEALARYQHALKLKPGYAEAHVNTGNALLSLGQPAEAIACYEKAVALNPQLVDAHFNLGSVLLEQGRWSEAIPKFETVLQLNAEFVRAHRALGFALVKAGRTADAVRHYEQYIRLSPDDGVARDELRQLRASFR